MAICTYYEDRVHIFWEKHPKAQGYKVYKKTDEHLFTMIKDTGDDNHLQVFYAHQGDKIKIKPYRIENNEKITDLGQEVITLDKDLTFKELQTETIIQKSCAQIAWRKIENARFYEIHSNSKLLTITENCEVLLKCLPIGETKLTIQARDNDKNFITSKEITLNIDSFELFAVNAPNYKIDLKWNKAHNISGYRIFKKNLKNEFEGFASVTDTEVFTATNVKKGEVCEFKVKPYTLNNQTKVYGDLADKTKVKVNETDKISLTILEAYNNQLAISYDFSGDVDGFELYKNGNLIKTIDDGLSHIVLIDFDSSAHYSMKGYKDFCGEKIYTCYSDKMKLHNSRDFKPEKYKVSVVIPAYNSHDYISRTIATVLASTLDDLELILVDDGSKDNTKEVLSWYAEKYPNFVKAIFKENSGVCDTRNKGIEKATGEFIAFMDNDDMIRPHAFENLYNEISKNNTDIAVAPLYRIDNDKYLIRHKLPFEEHKAIDTEKYLKLLFSKSYSNIGIWNKLYRAELVKSHLFGQMVYEDVSWTPYILSWAETFCYLNEVCYEWDRKIRPSTQSNVLSNKSAEEKFKERYNAVKFFYDNGNPKHKECLAYLMTKRLYDQGQKAKFEGYFDAIRELRPILEQNKYLLSDENYAQKVLDCFKN